MNLEIDRQRQQGVVLIIALLMLLLIAIVATTVSQVSVLQLFMAGNDQAKSEAQQHSLAAIDAILANADDNAPVVGGIGYVVCKQGKSCDADIINLSTPLTGIDLSKYTNYTVTRMAPLETTLPTMDEDMASSGTSYKAARFEVQSIYDDTANGQGRSTLTQGVLVKLAASAQ